MVDPAPSSSSLSLNNSVKKTDYENWTREELIDKIRKLELHVFQLRQVIAKRPDSKQCFLELDGNKRKRGEDGSDDPSQFGRKVKKTRPFDFSQHSTRHVALKFLYLGWDYQGLATQEDTNGTIEAYLFKALTVTRLIEERSKSNYHRCGRTDKGVSAFQQVISIDLRSKVVDGEETIDYCFILNRVLPKEIRALAWAPVRPNFSARFNCNERTYKYFFPRGNLNFLKMQEAANYLVGEHDFRHLCKLDKDKEKTSIRRVICATIVAPPGESPLDMCKLVIVGRSFIWHQIRCIAAVLLLVGKELEEPKITAELLDIEKNPRKPCYSMAVDYPLVLYDVKFPKEEGIKWMYSKTSIDGVLFDLQQLSTEHSIKTAMITEMMNDVEPHADSIPKEHVNSLIMGSKRKSYVKLFDRPLLLLIHHLVIESVVATPDDYINFSDMGNYDHSVQKNIDKKMSEFGMVPRIPRVLKSDGIETACDSRDMANCIRAMEYLQRIVKSLLRQMNVHSHVFGPGEAITIDLQAELKYDDYVILTKFMNSKSETDKYLYRIDEIMSNFIRVVDHSSRFDIFESVIRFPAFYSLKFWMILLTSMVIGSLIVMLFIKAFNTRSVVIQLFYGFLIIFILSCVWTFSNMYEEKKAEIMTHMTQANSLPPKDCDYQNWNSFYGIWYWFRTNVLGKEDQCGTYYATTMTDPLWKVNPMEAISQSAAYFFFKPLDYIGEKLGGFCFSFLDAAPWWGKPTMFLLLICIMFLLLYGPFRISTPLLTIEPVWRPQVPAIERNSVQAIGHEWIRNEIVERPEGPVIKSIRNVTTDMDGFKEYLAAENLELKDSHGVINVGTSTTTVSTRKSFLETESVSCPRNRNRSAEVPSSSHYVPKHESNELGSLNQPLTDENNQFSKDKAKEKSEFDRNSIKVRKELLDDALKEDEVKAKTPFQNYNS